MFRRPSAEESLGNDTYASREIVDFTTLCEIVRARRTVQTLVDSGHLDEYSCGCDCSCKLDGCLDW